MLKNPRMFSPSKGINTINNGSQGNSTGRLWRSYTWLNLCINKCIKIYKSRAHGEQRMTYLGDGINRLVCEHCLHWSNINRYKYKDLISGSSNQLATQSSSMSHFLNAGAKYRYLRHTKKYLRSFMRLTCSYCCWWVCGTKSWNCPLKYEWF